MAHDGVVGLLHHAAEMPPRTPHGRGPAETNGLDRMTRRVHGSQLRGEPSFERHGELVLPRSASPCNFHEDALHAAVEISSSDVQRAHQKNRRGTIIVSPAFTGSVSALTLTCVSVPLTRRSIVMRFCAAWSVAPP